jgi:ABC-type Fe3+-siderophore transport system permease subunit
MTDEAKPGPAGAKPMVSQTYPVNAAHLMRTAQLAQLQLSAMADTKASILMGATFVIFTITIGQARQGGAPIPLLILGGAAFFAAICTVLAVLPLTRNRRPTAQSNLLFFGVFSQMSEEEFTEALLARLTTEDDLYRTMARDIHQAGSVLQNKKYRFLGYAYRIFLAGLVASCASYVILYLI